MSMITWRASMYPNFHNTFFFMHFQAIFHPLSRMLMSPESLFGHLHSLEVLQERMAFPCSFQNCNMPWSNEISHIYWWEKIGLQCFCSCTFDQFRAYFSFLGPSYNPPYFHFLKQGNPNRVMWSYCGHFQHRKHFISTEMSAWELSRRVSTCKQRWPFQAQGLSHPKLSVPFSLIRGNRCRCNVKEMLHSRGRSLIQIILIVQRDVHIFIHNNQ